MQLPSVPRLVLSCKKQVCSLLNNKRFKKDPKFITSSAQAAPDGTVRGLPPGVMVFAPYDKK